MGNPENYLDDKVKKVSLNLKKVSRDLPTVGVRITKLKKEPPCLWRGRRWRPVCGRWSVTRYETMGFKWRTRSEEELIVMEVITVARLRKGMMLG